MKKLQLIIIVAIGMFGCNYVQHTSPIIENQIVTIQNDTEYNVDLELHYNGVLDTIFQIPAGGQKSFIEKDYTNAKGEFISSLDWDIWTRIPSHLWVEFNNERRIDDFKYCKRERFIDESYNSFFIVHLTPEMYDAATPIE